MKINILSVVKGVAELAISAGVGVVVGNLVKATTPYDLNKFQKVMVGIGGYGVGAVLGDLSAKHISAQIDDYAVRLDELIHPSHEVEEAAEDLKEAVGDVKDATVTLIQKGTDHVVTVDKEELKDSKTEKSE